MDPHDIAHELVQKALADEYAAECLIGDQCVDDAIIGFHYQQAAEKFLKAILMERQIEWCPFTG